MSREIKCPICGKVIGKRVVVNRISLGSLGCSDVCKAKIDYRKAAHVFWHEYRASGTLCKKCAKEKFPEGFVYYVAFKSAKGEDVYVQTGGDYDGGVMFATAEKAYSVRDEMNQKHGGGYSVKAIQI